jgi:peptide/nickel transport system permease protein
MFGFLARRLAQSLLALIALLTVVFLLSRLTGDPTNLYLPIEATREARDRFAEQHGFDQPLLEQFVRYLSDAVRLDFGNSLFQARPALTVVLEAFPVTLQLALITMTISGLLAIAIGSLAAHRPNGAFDRVASLLTLIGASLPDFWVAIVAILFFAVTLQWLPTSGMGGPVYWLMPVGVLLIRPLGVLTQVVRSSLLGVLASPFIQTARAKGASPGRVVYVHALRNALLPAVTVAGDLAAGFLNGAVVVETIFGWPGIGNLMINAIKQRDFAVIQACILVIAISVFVLNILIDLVYARLDPRIRTGAAS